MSWKRRIGGRGGPTLTLPAGCISDDTQLRLAVSRSFGPKGFDPEVFAKVELTVWASYALGGGRGSKEAASNLTRRDASWATNFFDTARSTYVNGGGNGAAMRIQPHVWAAAPRISRDDFIAAIVSDAVVTHGHPRGILGAVFHGLALRRTLLGGAVGGPPEWEKLLSDLLAVVDVIQGHDELGGLWLNMWEQRSRQSLEGAVIDAINEMAEDIRALETADGRGLEGIYHSAVEALGAFKVEQRGSGTKTALLASFLAWRANGDAGDAMIVAANRLGTDTDSIATMAGALLGALGISPPEQEISDRTYIEQEADRMWALSTGTTIEPFPHPDLRRWQPPRSQSDVLGIAQDGDHLVVSGLGPAEPASEVHATSGKSAPGWQWVDLWFGQRILAKRRAEPTTLDSSQVPVPSDSYIMTSLLDDIEARQQEERAVRNEIVHYGGDVEPTRTNAQRTLHELTNEAIRSLFDPAVMGRHLVELSASPQGIELSAQYASIVAKALMSRRDAQQRSNG